MPLPLLAFAVLLQFALAEAAFAHAQLRSADPVAGAVVSDVPETVTLTFNEPVAPLGLRWIAPDGTMVEVPGTPVGDSVVVAPPPGLGAGTHFLSWRVASGDGHPVGGTHGFHVGAPSGAASGAIDSASGAARAAAAARSVLTVALAVALGSVLVPALVSRRAPDRALRRGGLVAAAVGAAAAGALLGAQGLDLLALPPAALLAPDPWLAAWDTPLAVTVQLTALSLFLAALALVRASGRSLALAAWAVGAASFAASGHAATAEPRIVARAALFLHGGALLFWLGALWPLLRIVRRKDAVEALSRFSGLAVPVVALLALSGAALVWLQTGHPGALIGSAWGLTLVAKLALVGILVAIAARNRLVLLPALAAEEPQAPLRLARSIRREVLMALAIVILASALRLAPPPRAIAAAEVEPLYLHLHGDGAMADLRMTPGRAGPVAVTFAFQTLDFAELVPKEVEVIFAQPEAGIEPIRVTALRDGGGMWNSGRLTLPRPGDWDVTLRLLITDFESTTLAGSLTLPE